MMQLAERTYVHGVQAASVLRLAWLLALGVCLAMGFAQQTVAAGPTQVRIFKPFNPNGDLVVGLAVTGKIEGSCWTESLAAPGRPDAWRCMAGNTIYDPCFASLAGSELACAQEPWAANAVLLTLHSPLPERTAPTGPLLTGLPWALELENGRRCTLLTGATTGIAGMRLNYGCTGDTYAVGDIDRSLPRWRVFFGTQHRSLALDQVGVVTAWY